MNEMFIDANSIEIFVIYTALSLVVYLGLVGLVVRERYRSRIGLGTGDSVELLKAVRTQANAAEYLPLGLVALFAMALLSAPDALMHIVGVALVLSRPLHAWGLMQTTGRSIGRSAGMLLTWGAFLIAAGWLFFAVIR